ncbi:peptidase, M16 family protein [Algoriphagus boseongensis]|uniref:peptidase, M16 family protein n=1 Tax=Algoriphagus boseongensis TaxID=1442587 RepID=UPI001FB785EB|nr:peptidase, M16 family protein [Algoriphagus boseongensis]
MKITTLILASSLAVGSLPETAFLPNSKPTYEQVVDENDPEEILAKYLQAIGGEEKLAKIKNVSMTALANFQGQSIEIKSISDAENQRMMQSTAVSGNVMQKTLLVNGKAQVVAMGQVQELPEEMVAMLKAQTYVFPEAHYSELGYQLSSLGESVMDGQEVVGLQITLPNGMITKEYYSKSTGLKHKTSSDATGEITYSDYQEQDGILFPMMLSIKNPMLPVALEAKITSLKFNQSLTDSDFQ